MNKSIRTGNVIAFIALFTSLCVSVFPPHVQAQDLTSLLSHFLVDLRAGTLGVNQAITSITVGNTVNAARYQLSGVDVISASVCSNTAASGDITGTASKTYFSLNCKVPANSLAAGDTVALDLRGVYSGNVADTMVMTVEACQVSGCASGTKVTLTTTGALTLTAVANQGWELDEHIVTFTNGAGGTLDTQGKAFYETGSVTAVIDWTPNTGTVVMDTTVDEYISASVTFSSNNAGNHASIRNLIGIIQ